MTLHLTQTSPEKWRQNVAFKEKIKSDAHPRRKFAKRSTGSRLDVSSFDCARLTEDKMKAIAPLNNSTE